MGNVVLRPRNGLSLCAGAGGLDMGLMLAEPDFHTRCFAEWEEYPRSAIIAAQRAGYFDPAPIWDDVTTFDGQPYRGAIDTILAGYPCQPFSQAGRRKGKDDPRHLWPQIARIIREIEPRWVFLENVSGHVSLGSEAVLRELRDMGFTPSAGLFSASEVGAPHQRLRWFCVAYRNSQDGQPDSRKPNSRTDGRDESIGGGGKKLADAARTDGERDGRKPARCAGYSDGGSNMADASNEGLQGGSQQGDEATSLPKDKPDTGRGGIGIFPPWPADETAWASIMRDTPDFAPAVSLSDVKRAADNFAEMVARGDMAEAEAQSKVRRMAHGMAQRSRALRLLGNGVVPLCAAYAWRTLANAHGLRPVDLGANSRNSGPRTN